MELEHFSHPEHPLSLIKETSTRLDESGNGVVCNGCDNPIDDGSSTFYECAPCQFYLHKPCAEAPREIIYALHPKHQLTLFSKQPYETLSTTCTCNVCQRSDWKWFTYNCSRCQFDLDIICALKDMHNICDVNEDRSLKHNGHPHSLTLQQRPGLFHCDACDTSKTVEYFYSCNTCHFWIHKRCALLPNTKKFSHHNHDLDLAYSFPKSHNKYRYYCDICRLNFDAANWIYYCGLCRYFVHLNCAITFDNTPDPALQSDDKDYEKLEMFPIDGDRSPYPISEFVKKILGDAYSDEEEGIKIHHWYHTQHPLILADGQSDNNSDIVYDGMRCAACTQPIKYPFYHCSKCSFFIHRNCALLPLELKHEAHLDHPLKLIDGSTQEFKLFSCTLCRMPTSGFFYSCEICKISISIGCISFPTKILHKSHQHHPLTMTSKVSDCECEGCGKIIPGFAYQCKTCEYTIDYGCATRYPHTLTHDYDEHPLYLTYPPIENPSDFFCEICEEEMHPKRGMYCCKICRFYFHVNCLYDRYATVLFGWKFEDSKHWHPLTFIRNGPNNSPCICSSCGKNIINFPVFKCNECDFTMCVLCK